MATKINILKLSTGLGASLAVLGFIAVAPAGPMPIPIGNVITVEGGAVYATFISKEAADTDLIFLTPSTTPVIFDNTTAHAGDTKYLGSFAAGTVLTFTLFIVAMVLHT